MIPSESRCRGLTELIEQKQYFVIHAARQTGKTTLLLDLVKKLNNEGRYYALYCSLLCSQGIDDREAGVFKIIEEFESVSGFTGDPSEPYSDLDCRIIKYCKQTEKPVIIFFDDTDCLSDDVQLFFLRQIRSKFAARYDIPFPSAICFAAARKLPSWFNIITATFRLTAFTKDEVAQLYGQHTEQTGQAFSGEVIQAAYHHTQGQPWLVNAVAREITVKILGGDVSQRILKAHVGQAVETVIQRRDTHIDSLLMRLQEERVIRIVGPMFAGEEIKFAPLDDDLQFVRDLGLIKIENGVITPSCPMYEEVMVRYLGMADNMDHQKYQLPVYAEKNRLNIKKLLTDFQNFWRENSAIWQERFQYKEAAPHLILMAFLQRIINTGGRIDREMATGRRRIDLCIHYQNQKYPVEIKIRRDAKTLEEGKKQLADYTDTLGCNEGWLVIFDRRKKISWKSRLFWKTGRINDKEIHVAGC